MSTTSKQDALVNHEKLLAKSITKAKQGKGSKPPSSPPHKAKAKPNAALRYRRLDKVQAQPINWLWQGRIALGKVTLIAGDPGLGKSQITAFLAGIVTTGGRWPVDGAKSPQGGVIFLSSEDDAADTIRPRLEAVNADLSRCVVVDAAIEKDESGLVRERAFSVKKDLAKLEAVLREVPDVRLIVIDPITAYMGGIDSHKTSDVREFMAPLGQFAEKHRLAILGISHLNKSGTQEAMQRINGSLAIVAAARAAFVAVKDKSNPARRLLLPLKNNLAKDIGGFAFQIESRELDSGIVTSCTVWEDSPVHMTADEAMNARPPQEDNGKIGQAVQFLLDMLAGGALPSDEVKEAANDAGFSGATLRRAKENAGVIAKKDSFNGGWIWVLSEDAQHEDAHPLYTTNEHLRRGRATQGLEGYHNNEDAHVVSDEHLRKSGASKTLVLESEL